MTFYHARRAQAHSEGFTYTEPATGEIKKLTPNARVLLFAICLEIPDKVQGEKNPCEGERYDLTLEALSKLTGIPAEGVSEARETLFKAELIDSWQPAPNKPYVYRLHRRLMCSWNDCLDSKHYPDKWPGVVKTTPLGDEEQPRQGGRYKGGRGVMALEHKETKNTKEPLRTPSGEQVTPTPEPETRLALAEDLNQETLEKRSQARLRVNELLKERGQTLPPNLLEWVIIMRTNGKDKLDQALEWAGQGYDLKPEGRWCGGRADVFEELTKIWKGN